MKCIVQSLHNIYNYIFWIISTLHKKIFKTWNNLLKSVRSSFKQTHVCLSLSNPPLLSDCYISKIVTVESKSTESKDSINPRSEITDSSNSCDSGHCGEKVGSVDSVVNNDSRGISDTSESSNSNNESNFFYQYQSIWIL